MSTSEQNPSISVSNSTGATAPARPLAWIQSARFDCLLLILVPLTVLPLVAGTFVLPGVVRAVVLALAFAHYASSFVFYLWDDNRSYHRARWLAFFAGPALIAGVYTVLLNLGLPQVITFVVLFWNTWHVARQNCGILSLYRSQAGVADASKSQRSAANQAILAVSAFLVLWNVDTHADVLGLFKLVSNDFLLILRVLAASAALIAVAQLAYRVARREVRIGIPEGLFLLSSLAFFYPYLVARTSAGATAILLVPHYVQYMALLWLLHRRKFRDAAQGAPKPIRFASTHLYTLIASLAVIGGSFYVLKEVADHNGFENWFENFFLVLALIHFYIDGLNWSFRRTHMRQTMLPFLVRRDPPLRETA